MMRISTFFCLCILIAFDLLAQQTPLYTQYIFDPYLVNPSLLASSRKSEVNLLYRQQWTGIEDGPKTIQFDFQHAFNNRTLIGINLYDDKTILLSRTSVMATFGYRIPLAKDHELSFGLSGGFNSNRVKTEDVPSVDINDPVLLNSAANNFSFDGQFGVSYTYRNLLLGFSLVRLVDNTTFSEEQLQMPEFDEFKNAIILAGYKFNINKDFSFQPNFIYRITADDLNFFETSGVFSYKEMISLGGGYRENYGPTVIARVSIKDLQVGFSYDFPSTKAEVSTGGTNELQLKWRFGATVEKLTKRERTSDEIVLAEEPKSSQEVKEEPSQEQEPLKSVIKEETKPVVVEESVKPIEEKRLEEVTTETSDTDEFLLIAGSFNKKANADKLIKELSNQGYVGEIIHDKNDNYYYVHVPKYRTDTVTLDKVLEIRNLDIFKDAWYKRVDK